MYFSFLTAFKICCINLSKFIKCTKTYNSKNSLLLKMINQKNYQFTNWKRKNLSYKGYNIAWIIVSSIKICKNISLKIYPKKMTM